MIISITHEHDLDGLGSQSIIKRFYDRENKDLELNFAHYIDFNEKIERILKKCPEKLYITDLGFNRNFLRVFKDFKSAKLNGSKILWFDHHIIEETIKIQIQEFCNKYINDTSKCASEIVQSYFLPNDDVSRKIARLAHDSDFKQYKFPLSKDLQLIIEHNRGELKTREKNIIVHLLSRGDFDNPWFKSQLEELKTWYTTQSKLALKNSMIISLPKGEKFIISNAELGGGKITDILKEKYPKFIAYIGIDSRFNEIIIQSPKINCRNFAMSLGGGGHKMRAGFTFQEPLKSKHINPHFISLIKERLSDYL